MARPTHVSVPIYELTDRQIHLHLIGLLDQQTAVLKSLEKQMADINKSVEDLEAAVDAINERFAGQLLVLKESLDAANQALADEELDDAAKDQALSDALQNASDAADRIDSQVNELNQIGADPSSPPEPNQDLPGDQPQVDNTLPGDLPSDESGDEPQVEHH